MTWPKAAGNLTLNFNCMKTIVPTALCAVGIDVSSEKLSICLRKEDRTKEFMEIRNAEADIARFMKKSIAGYAGKIVLESTGRHHLLSAVKLSERGFDARVINPLMSKKYSSSAIRKVKSDRRDAEILAEMAEKEEKLPDTFAVSPEILEIRKKIALLGALEKESQRLNAVMNDFEKTKNTLKMKLSRSEKAVRKISREIGKVQTELEKEVVAEARKNAAVSERVRRYMTIPGVSEYTATVAACSFKESVNEQSKQWVAFAGLDISVRESGKWKGRGRLTKRGNPYLRKRLFQAAWGAKMHDEQFKRYYDELRQNGRTYTEAMVIIARKIVRIMFSLEKNKAEYDSRDIGSLNAN
jgi:transposase